MIGLPPISKSGLGMLSVSGLSLVPNPAPKIKAVFICLAGIFTYFFP
jgi:hypothetical protein